MIGIMLEHDFMIKKSICDTLVLTKRVFSGSDQIPLNTLGVYCREVLKEQPALTRRPHCTGT